MTQLNSDVEVARPGGTPRTFAFLGCPACAGTIAIETNGRGANPPLEIAAFPSLQDGVNADVRHLPEDVQRYYIDAKTVLLAAVPDAAAVQLRRTLEAAAAHFGHDDGPLVGRITGLIEDGLITRGSVMCFTWCAK